MSVLAPDAIRQFLNQTALSARELIRAAPKKQPAKPSGKTAPDLPAPTDTGNPPDGSSDVSSPPPESTPEEKPASPQAPAPDTSGASPEVRVRDQYLPPTISITYQRQKAVTDRRFDRALLQGDKDDRYFDPPDVTMVMKVPVGSILPDRIQVEPEECSVKLTTDNPAENLTGYRLDAGTLTLFLTVDRPYFALTIKYCDENGAEVYRAPLQIFHMPPLKTSRGAPGGNGGSPPPSP